MRQLLLRLTAAIVAVTLVSSDAFGRGGGGGGRAGGHGRPHHGYYYPATGTRPVVSAAPAATSAEEAVPEPVWQNCRYLRIKNDTDQKITVYLQYRTWTTKQRFIWYPALPAGDKALVFEIEPGAETDLDHDGWQIPAPVRTMHPSESFTGSTTAQKGPRRPLPK
jgi:hypothetical protein